MELSTFTALMLIAVSMILVMRHFLRLGRFTDRLLALEVSVLLLIPTVSLTIDLFVFRGEVLLVHFIGRGMMDSLLALINTTGTGNILYLLFTALLLIMPMVGAIFYLAGRETPV